MPPTNDEQAIPKDQAKTQVQAKTHTANGKMKGKSLKIKLHTTVPAPQHRLITPLHASG